jgi:hypothetical protein
MKVPAKYYREIEYVLVSELPDAQQALLTLSRDLDYIKILIDGEVTGPCLQYKDYQRWYTTIYALHVKPALSPKEWPVKKLVWEG